MVTQNNPIRTCGYCKWYKSYPEDPPRLGMCLLSDSVKLSKRNLFLKGVSSQDLCRYGSFAENTRNGTRFTQEEIAEIVNRAPKTLLEKVTAADINLFWLNS